MHKLARSVTVFENCLHEPILAPKRYIPEGEFRTDAKIAIVIALQITHLSSLTLRERAGLMAFVKPKLEVRKVYQSNLTLSPSLKRVFREISATLPESHLVIFKGEQ
jgi:hypothetical protein